MDSLHSPRVPSAGAVKAFLHRFNAGTDAGPLQIRFAICRGDGADCPAPLAAAPSGARHTAWLKWNGKKIFKAALGADYPGLAARFARMERGAGSSPGN